MPDLLTNDGIRLHYTMRGEGPLPVICLHWLGGCTDNWDGLVDHLDLTRQRLITLDLRGHGRSAPEPCDLTNDRLGRDVLHLAEALQLRRFAVMGHSYGGKLALQIASAIPAQVRALILLGAVGPGCVPLDRTTVEPLLQNSADAAFLRVAFGPWMQNWTQPELVGALEQFRLTPVWALRAVCEAALWTDVSARITGLTMPALVVAGDRDPVYGPAYQEQAVQPFLPHAQQVTIAGCGHGLHLERPAEVAAVVSRFLHPITQDPTPGRRQDPPPRYVVPRIAAGDAIP